MGEEEYSTLNWKRCTTWELQAKFYLGQNEDCSPGGSISDSSERLLQSGNGGRSIYKVLVKGSSVPWSTHFTKGFLLVMRIWCHHKGVLCFSRYEDLIDLTVWITINCGKFWKRWEYQTTWSASWETCMQVRKEQLEPDMEQQTGSKQEKEYVKVVYCHPAYLTYMQSTSWETLGRKKHKLESR